MKYAEWVVWGCDPRDCISCILRMSFGEFIFLGIHSAVWMKYLSWVVFLLLIDGIISRRKNLIYPFLFFLHAFFNFVTSVYSGCVQV
jgi:hypothetical protein